MSKNPWLKLSAVSFAGIIISFGLLWGINQFSGSNSNQGIYQNRMQVSMNAGSNGMNMQGNMNMQGSSGMQGNTGMQGNMGMQGDMNSGMGMMDNTNNSQNSMGMH